MDWLVPVLHRVNKKSTSIVETKEVLCGALALLRAERLVPLDLVLDRVKGHACSRLPDGIAIIGSRRGEPASAEPVAPVLIGHVLAVDDLVAIDGHRTGVGAGHVGELHQKPTACLIVHPVCLLRRRHGCGRAPTAATSPPDAALVRMVC